MLSSFKNLLKTRDFKNLWFGQAISRIGDAFYYIGPLFVIKKIFNDDSMVGYVGALESIPYLFMGPIAGAIADRFDRKKIMIWADVLSALILFAFLAYLLLTPGNPPRWPFYVFGPLLAACRVFFFPAKDATIPRVLPAEKLMDGNSLNASTDQTMWLVGNMLTASFSSIADFYGAKNFLIIMVFINAITFLGSVYYLSLLPSVVPERKEPHEEGMLVDVIKGIEYAKRDKVIGLSLLATVGLSFFMSPFMVVYLATNNQWFSGKAWSIAFIESCFIFGLLIMSFIIPKLNIKKAGIAFSIGMAVAGVMVCLMGASPIFTMYCIWNTICGIAIGVVNVPMMTYRQLKVPDEYRGRVGSLGNLIWMGVQPIGMALGGQLLAFFGIVWMHILMGLGFAITGSAPLLNKEFRTSEIPEPSDDNANSQHSGDSITIHAHSLGPTIEPLEVQVDYISHEEPSSDVNS